MWHHQQCVIGYEYPTSVYVGGYYYIHCSVDAVDVVDATVCVSGIMP